MHGLELKLAARILLVRNLVNKKSANVFCAGTNLYDSWVSRAQRDERRTHCRLSNKMVDGFPRVAAKSIRQEIALLDDPNLARIIVDLTDSSLR